MGNECCGGRRSYAKQLQETSAPEPLMDKNKDENDCQSLQMASQVQPQEVAERTEAADVSANISYASVKIRVEETTARNIRLKSVDAERQRRTKEDSFDALRNMALFR